MTGTLYAIMTESGRRIVLNNNQFDGLLVGAVRPSARYRHTQRDRRLTFRRANYWFCSRPIDFAAAEHVEEATTGYRLLMGCLSVWRQSSTIGESISLLRRRLSQVSLHHGAPHRFVTDGEKQEQEKEEAETWLQKTGNQYLVVLTPFRPSARPSVPEMEMIRWKCEIYLLPHEVNWFHRQRRVYRKRSESREWLNSIFDEWIHQSSSNSHNLNSCNQ